MSQAIADMGFYIAAPIEISNGSEFDLSDPKIQRLVIQWIRRRRFWLVHLGTPCKRWSRSNTTGISELVDGLPLAAFTVRVLRACRQAGVFFTLENPSACFRAVGLASSGC